MFFRIWSQIPEIFTGKWPCYEVVLASDSIERDEWSQFPVIIYKPMAGDLLAKAITFQLPRILCLIILEIYRKIICTGEQPFGPATLAYILDLGLLYLVWILIMFGQYYTQDTTIKYLWYQSRGYFQVFTLVQFCWGSCCMIITIFNNSSLIIRLNHPH